mgnify:CR=1 FL=1
MRTLYIVDNAKTFINCQGRNARKMLFLASCIHDATDDAKALETKLKSNTEKKEYKCGHKGSPGPGGMKCPCCVLGSPTEAKKRINRIYRRKQKKLIKNSEDE